MTTIDWTKPVETTEDPPRPVRVLCTDNDVPEYPIVVIWERQPIMFTAAGTEWPDGTGIRLRNVAPPEPEPKPKPVLRAAWVALYGDGSSPSQFFRTKEACETATLSHGRVECRRIAWMSDGSPVEDDGLAWRKQIAATQEAEAERDAWKAKAEALQAEVERQKPVVDAAVAWDHSKDNRSIIENGRTLIDAIRTYEAPADPVKSCTTCRLYAEGEGCGCLLETHCASNLSAPFHHWRPRHD